GYAYQLLQGAAFEGWTTPAAKAYCWQDPKLVRFELQVPANTGGLLRLHLIDGDGQNRQEKVTVQGKAVGEVKAFTGPGVLVEVPVAAADVKDGKIEVAVQNLGSAGTAAVSTVEFVPAK